jgi:pantetheine-phosphate adenylyltransferase
MSKKRIGVYAGTFSPWHVGHADILHQSLNVFDEVIIALGRNPEKDTVTKEEFPHGNPILGKAKIVHFTGLLSDFLNQLDVDNEGVQIILIRGLRNGDDLQYEQNQLQFIKEMYPSLKTVFFICDKKFEHISSSSLRALRKVSEKEYEKYVFRPPAPPEGAKFGWTWDEHVVGGYKFNNDGNDIEFIQSGKTDKT